MPSLPSIGHAMSNAPTDAGQIGHGGDEAAFSSAAEERLGGESSSRPGAAAAPQSLRYTTLPDQRRLYETGYTGIYAKHRFDDFATQTKLALDKIAQAPSGKRLLADIAAASEGREGKHVSIVPAQSVATRPLLSQRQAEDRNMQQNDYSRDQNNLAGELSKKRTVLRVNVGNGPGAKAEIAWDPEQSLKLDSRGRPYQGLFDNPSQAHLVLAHELVHAVHILKGNLKFGGDRLDPVTQSGKEELRAVGLGKYVKKTPYSENSIRQELGFPQRSQYNRVPDTPERSLSDDDES